MSQPESLFDVAAFVAPPREGTIQQRFEAFVDLNPWIVDALIRMALDLKARGRERIGIKGLVEVLRWHYWRQTTDPSSEFKINNSYTSRLARLIVDREPSLEGCFELRELRAA